MSSIPVPPGVQSVEHPSWCDRQHAENWPVHSADIGEDISLGESKADLSISLYQDQHRPAQVWLMEHRDDDTAVTALSAEQAEQLGWRLIEAAGRLTGQAGQDREDLLIGRMQRMLLEHRTAHRGQHGHGNSGSSGAL